MILSTPADLVTDSAVLSQTMIFSFLIRLSLTVAMGARGIFILYQGMMRNHVFTVCTLSFLCDAILIALGTLGLGMLINGNTSWTGLLSLFGAFFLFFYGWRMWRYVFSSKAISNVRIPANRSTIVVQTLAVSLLNPHVYLDSMVLLGGMASATPAALRLDFAIGAIAASFFWFYTLGYSARWFTHYLLTDKGIRITYIIVGSFFWLLALRLLSSTSGLFVSVPPLADPIADTIFGS